MDNSLDAAEYVMWRIDGFRKRWPVLWDHLRRLKNGRFEVRVETKATPKTVRKWFRDADAYNVKLILLAEPMFLPEGSVYRVTFDRAAVVSPNWEAEKKRRIQEAGR